MKGQVIKLIQLFLFSLIPLNINLSQSLNLQTFPNVDKQFGFSFDKPFYTHDNNYSELSGVYQLYINTPISSKLNLIGNIPFINISYENDYGFGNYEFSENGLGNIFFGMQTNSDFTDNSRTIISFGVFLPTSEEKVAPSGSQINFYDLQKYISNSLGLYFNFALQKTNVNGINLGFEVGPNVIIPTEGDNRDVELLLHYGLDLGYQIEKIMLNLEFLGMGIVTEDIDNFEDRLIHQLNFGLQWKGSIVTPKVYYRVYLKEEMREMIDGVLGFGINVAID
jgi:hypothetical protein